MKNFHINALLNCICFFIVCLSSSSCNAPKISSNEFQNTNSSPKQLMNYDISLDGKEIIYSKAGQLYKGPINSNFDSFLNISGTNATILNDGTIVATPLLKTKQSLAVSGKSEFDLTSYESKFRLSQACASANSLDIFVVESKETLQSYSLGDIQHNDNISLVRNNNATVVTPRKFDIIWLFPGCEINSEVFFIASDDLGEHQFIWKCNTKNKSTTKLLKKGVPTCVTVSNATKKVAYLDLDAPDWSLYLTDPTFSYAKKVFTWREEVGQIRFSPDGKVIYAEVKRGSGQIVLEAVDISTGERTELRSF